MFLKQTEDLTSQDLPHLGKQVLDWAMLTWETP